MKKRNNTNPVVPGTIDRLLIAFLGLTFLLVGLSACDTKKDTPLPSTALPAAPTGLTVSPQVGRDSLVWNFNVSTDYVTAYNVYSGSSESSLVKISTVGLGKEANLSFLHTGLTNGTTYYYAVSAVNSKGEGPKSAIVSCVPNLPITKTTTVTFLQSLPAIVQPAPWRYYDKNAKPVYINNPFALTDTFKLFPGIAIFAGSDSTIYLKGNTNVIDVLYQDFTSIKYANSRELSSSPNMGPWLWGIVNLGSGYESNYSGYIDTLPLTFKISGLSSVNQIKNIYVNDLYEVLNQTALSSQYQKTLNLSDFLVVQGYAKLDKTKPTIYQNAGEYSIVIPIRLTGRVRHNAKIIIRYTDGSETTFIACYV